MKGKNGKPRLSLVPPLAPKKRESTLLAALDLLENLPGPHDQFSSEDGDGLSQEAPHWIGPDMEWQELQVLRMRYQSPVPPTKSRLIVKRHGRAITRQITRPTVVIDTREQVPFSFLNFPNWIARTEVGTLKVGDYSVRGMEDVLTLERKSLPDLLKTLTQDRQRFFRECEVMAGYKYKAIIIEASYEDVKSRFDYLHCESSAHPNGISGSLDAVEARWGIPVIYTSQYRPLAEEKAASWLSKLYTYWILEDAGYGRCFQEGDL